jgi:hypothetical protein
MPGCHGSVSASSMCGTSPNCTFAIIATAESLVRLGLLKVRPEKPKLGIKSKE